MINWYCNKRRCRKLLKKVYRINIFSRDPNHTYTTSKLPVIHSENNTYCKEHFEEVMKKIQKIL